MLQDDEEDELSYVRTKAVSKEFFKLYLKGGGLPSVFRDGHVAKGPTGPEETKKIDVSPKDKAAETVANFVLDRSKEIIERLTPELVQELKYSPSVLEFGLEQFSDLCSKVLESCRSWLRERDDKASAIFVTAGTVARELQLQEGIPQEVRKARIDMLAGNVGKVLKEHNLEACILERYETEL
ncbi:hypothetical protein EMCRGX_G012920 [Ephydatia muelleri]